MSDRILRSALGAFLLLGTLGACSEQFTSTLGCPELCKDESAVLRDTILTGAVVVDTSFLGFPQLGEDRDIALLNQGDTADVRLVTRFDSLPTRYQITGATSDSLIRMVDSVTFIFMVDTLAPKPEFPLTIDAFDVDTTLADSARTALLPLFRADRLIGSHTIAAGDFKDTVRLSLDKNAVFAKVRDSLRLRIGLRVRGQGSARLKVLGNSYIPRIRMRVTPDTSVAPDTVFPRSLTPTANPELQVAYAFYPIVAGGLLAQPPLGQIVIGGLAGARTYLRFDIPSNVIDSVQVIRASLLLTQAPPRSPTRPTDSVTVYVHPVLASPTISDLFLASTFLGSPTLYGVDTVRFKATDVGTRSIELVNLIRFWRLAGSQNTQRAIVLRSPAEGGQAAELSFFSTEALLANRPRLRLTYVPRRGFGIP